MEKGKYEFKPMQKAKAEVVELNPKWSEVLPWLLSVIENPRARKSSIDIVKKELTRMAEAADKYNEFIKGTENDL